MADAAITVTMKAGKGFEAHWAVFKGASVEEVRDHIEEYFEMEKDPNLSLNEVVNVAEGILQGVSNALKGLKGDIVEVTRTNGDIKVGRVVGESSGNKSKASAVAESANDSEGSVSPAEALAAQMAAAATVDDLRALWVDNKALYDAHKIVKDAYKKRGSELTA